MPAFADCTMPSMIAWYKKLRSFIDAIKENGTAPVPSSQILYNQAIIDGIVQSAKAGKEVEIHLEEI